MDKTDPALLLYEAGYVTIQKFEGGTYTLVFPNQEMENTFYKDMHEAAKDSENDAALAIGQMSGALTTKPAPDFHYFMTALDTGMLSLGVRAPMEEWYDWQMLDFMVKGNIP